MDHLKADETSGILYAARNGIATLTISQPAKMNAMTYDMWLSLPGLVARAVGDATVRAIALTGAGEKAFCAGADISQFGDKRSGDATALYDAAVAAGMNAVLEAAKPTVAVIRGICFGGGNALALMCDIRLATADSRFRVPAARLGLGYDYANTEVLVRKLGISAVADIMLSASILDAALAERYGVLHRAWPRERFEAEAAAYLANIAANAPLTLKAIKAALVELTKPEASRDAAAVDALVAACFTSADYREGQAAFLEKRLPQFRGE